MYYNVKTITYRDGIVDTRIYRESIETDRIEKKKSGKKIENEEGSERSSNWSISRTKQNIYEIARNGIWDYFVTLTFDGAKVDRYSYEEVTKKLSNWLSNLRKKCPDMEYIFVPEQHKDGAYHFHGFMSFIDEGCDIRDSGKRDKGEVIYNLDSYKFGWSTMTRVRDNKACTRYITKYITKELMESISGKKRYWCSRNLTRPVKENFLLKKADQCVLWQQLQEDALYTNHSMGDYQEVLYFQAKGIDGLQEMDYYSC